VHYLDEFHRLDVILQRLAHPHHHDVRQRATALPSFASRCHDLGDHLSSAKVPG
jgi:hypothetical protein